MTPRQNPPADWRDSVTMYEHVMMLLSERQRFMEERDRRYAEVALEREKALKIKEQADRDALGLAREIQTYKDEKANELRSQIERERGTYVTHDGLSGQVGKIEETLKPLIAYVAAQQGRGAGMSQLWGLLVGGILAAIAVVMFVVNLTRTTPPIPTSIHTTSQQPSGTLTQSSTTSRETPQ